MGKKGNKGSKRNFVGRRKVVGRKYVYFYNPRTKVWMKAKRLKNGRLKIVGKATKSEVEHARK